MSVLWFSRLNGKKWWVDNWGEKFLFFRFEKERKLNGQERKKKKRFLTWKLIFAVNFKNSLKFSFKTFCHNLLKTLEAWELSKRAPLSVHNLFSAIKKLTKFFNFTHLKRKKFDFIARKNSWIEKIVLLLKALEIAQMKAFLLNEKRMQFVVPFHWIYFVDFAIFKLKLQLNWNLNWNFLNKNIKKISINFVKIKARENRFIFSETKINWEHTKRIEC